MEKDFCNTIGTKRTYRGKCSLVRFWGKADMARPPLAWSRAVRQIKDETPVVIVAAQEDHRGLDALLPSWWQRMAHSLRADY